ncbi:F0F1 ATP synthase subunit B [Anabaenopsis tanganyikae CS-531]|uniref:ATP synthase subunit b n=2 Tax=Anabaenopsis TaxID=110103 RepID=A0ABT5AT78_9CYAN|nr:MULTISPECIES: F0F1 ATP synthase subunit B [Anabaenopsis]MDB9539616.1 F0F1 ATP synthase subunit B [Anabaenopsis arnoldii]MDH6091921.1 F0F1 ATP synthase subunit B [Anabaenopsis arnoldii]MDH6107438.1 F0F1 ATP synthase subunit B [Anabaenopsis tanganyikae CS-531]
MLIDWFTVIAQIINFLILVFLLWRFLYKPITKTMAERQRKITNRWEEAQLKQEEAEQEAQLYRRQQQELNEQRATLINQARATADEERQKLIHQARQEIESMQIRWREAIERDQDEFLTSLRQQVQEQTYAITRRALQDLADASLEQQVIKVFLNRLQKIDRTEIQTLVNQSSPEIVIYSSFDISPPERAKIVNTLEAQQISQDKNIKFTISSDNICGIKLQISNYQVSWTFNDYLETLSEEFSAIIKQSTN